MIKTGHLPPLKLFSTFTFSLLWRFTIDVTSKRLSETISNLSFFSSPTWYFVKVPSNSQDVTKDVMNLKRRLGEWEGP